VTKPISIRVRPASTRRDGTAHGRTAILPASILDYLGVQPGDEIEAKRTRNQSVVLTRHQRVYPDPKE